MMLNSAFLFAAVITTTIGSLIKIVSNPQQEVLEMELGWGELSLVQGSMMKTQTFETVWTLGAIMTAGVGLTGITGIVNIILKQIT